MKLHRTTEQGVYYYLTKNKGKLYMYRHRYCDAKGIRREVSKRGFKTQNQAYRSLLEVKIKLSDGKLTQIENRHVTVAEWMDIYYDFHKDNWKPSTRKVRNNIIDKWIKPLLGRYKLRELNDYSYKRLFIDEMRDSLSDSTIKATHSLFVIAMNYAVRKKVIESHNFNAAFSMEEVKSDNFYTTSELSKFEKHAKEFVNITGYTAILLLSRTGLRRSEAMGLQWDDIDFKNKTLSVKRIRDRYGTRSPKTKRSVRSFRVSDVLLNQLEIYRKWCIETKFKYGIKHEEDDLIFITNTSNPINESSPKQWFEKIYSKVEMKKITVHGLRHSHATVLVSRRVPTITVAERLGNTPAMIDRVYGHTYNELDDQCVNIMDEALM